MKKRILIVFVIIDVLIAILAVVIYTRPDTFRVSRSVTIAAPPAAVFEHVNDFRKWQGWSPWEGVDPELKRTYSGPESGTGAMYAWVGNSQVGEGKMTIAESRPAEFIRIKLEFIKPMEATSTAEFTFKPEGEQTVATWTMYGENNFLAKAMTMAMSMETMLGATFDQGLADLKAVSEKPAGQ